jgi:D-glycero-beta-D-manno-heptose-7-phosphate kinase
MFDRYLISDVEHISPEAPVPIVSIRQTEERLGSAANVARNISSLSARAGLLAVLGDDEAGKVLSSRSLTIADCPCETTDRQTLALTGSARA